MKKNNFVLLLFFVSIQTMDTTKEIYFGNLQRVASQFLSFHQNPNVENLGKLTILTQEISGKCPEAYKKSFIIYRDQYFNANIAKNFSHFSQKPILDDIDVINRWFSQVLSEK